MTFSREPYKGHNNEQIISLYNNLNDLEQEKLRISKEILSIHESCEHEYYLESTSMYEDCYTCIHCGHEYWK